MTELLTAFLSSRGRMWEETSHGDVRRRERLSAGCVCEVRRICVLLLRSRVRLVERESTCADRDRGRRATMLRAHRCDGSVRLWQVHLLSDRNHPDFLLRVEAASTIGRRIRKAQARFLHPDPPLPPSRTHSPGAVPRRPAIPVLRSADLPTCGIPSPLTRCGWSAIAVRWFGSAVALL